MQLGTSTGGLHVTTKVVAQAVPADAFSNRVKLENEKHQHLCRKLSELDARFNTRKEDGRFEPTLWNMPRIAPTLYGVFISAKQGPLLPCRLYAHRELSRIRIRSPNEGSNFSLSTFIQSPSFTFLESFL